MDILNFTVEPSDIGTRLDKYLTANITDVTRSSIQKLIDEDKITINGKNIKASYLLRENDNIEVCFQPPVEMDVLAEDIPLNIVYEDDDLIVINKPQGMVVHPAPGHSSGTIVNALLFHCKGQLSGINGVMRPGIVHRIDKDTSGVIVVAKSDFAHNHLSAQLKAHTMTRKYVAIVLNKVKAEKGRIDKAIGRDPNDRKKRAITLKNSKDAVTNYTVIQRYGKYTLIEAILETGRTHQIRVHMASIGHPILGDEVYGRHKFKNNLHGQLLHAKTLGFIHPRTLEYMEFETPLPDYFVKTIETIK